MSENTFLKVLENWLPTMIKLVIIARTSVLIWKWSRTSLHLISWLKNDKKLTLRHLSVPFLLVTMQTVSFYYVMVIKNIKFVSSKSYTTQNRCNFCKPHRNRLNPVKLFFCKLSIGGLRWVGLYRRHSSWVQRRHLNK